MNKIYILIILIILIILFTVILYKIEMYQYILRMVLKIKLKYGYGAEMYLYKNFNLIFKDITNINIDDFSNNSKIDLYKNDINMYKIIDMKSQYDFATNIVNNIDINKNIYMLLEKMLLHINVNNRNININDCVVIDLLKSDVQSFPSIHTDIEWSIFDNSYGFQAWYLYKNDDSVGNMFLLETDIVKPHSYLRYSENSVSQFEHSDGSIIDTLTYSDVNPKVKYLNMKGGECLLFCKNLYHMSDFRKSKYRYSINFRVILRDADGGIPVNLSKDCLYVNAYKKKLLFNNIKIINNKIYPEMFDLLHII